MRYPLLLWHGGGLFRFGPPEGWNANPAPRLRQHVLSHRRLGPVHGRGRAALGDADRQIQAACPCVVVLHSLSGNFAFNAALNPPDKVRAIIATEPSGAPPATADAARVRGIPHLFVWRDHIEGNALRRGVRANVARWQQQICATGGMAETLDLPASGIGGSSQMMMMDTNSDEIAGRVQAWIAALGLMR